jgi:uncharacterized protein (TIGR02466 family)
MQKILELFPTKVLMMDFEDRTLEIIQNEITQFLATMSDEDVGHPFEDNMLSSFRKRNYSKEPSLQVFRELLLHYANVYAKESEVTPLGNADLKLAELWVNISNKGMFQYDHGHGDAIVAGTYYFQTNGEDGNISFGNPSPIVFTGGTPFGHLSHEVEPRVGRLLLFPGWLVHKVKINNTDSTRISLSFNFHLTSK